MPALLSEGEIAAALATLAPWRQEGNRLTADFRLAGFREAIAFTQMVAELAEEMNHHPDISIRWNRVTLDLSTHSAGGITALDFQLARRICEAAAG